MLLFDLRQLFASLLKPVSMFIRLDLPTLERPMKAYSAFTSLGHMLTVGADITNSDFFISMWVVLCKVNKKSRFIMKWPFKNLESIKIKRHNRRGGKSEWFCHAMTWSVTYDNYRKYLNISLLHNLKNAWWVGRVPLVFTFQSNQSVTDVTDVTLILTNFFLNQINGYPLKDM